LITKSKAQQLTRVFFEKWQTIIAELLRLLNAGYASAKISGEVDSVTCAVISARSWLKEMRAFSVFARHQTG